MNGLLRRQVVVAGVLAVAPGILAAQEATVTGRVTSQDGAPVAYATVALEQLGLGALSRDDGRSTIVVPGARVLGQVVTLSARVIGYKPVSVEVTLSPGTVTQDFALELKAWFHLHLAEREPTRYAQALAEAQLGISSPVNDLRTFHGVTATEQNIWYQFLSSAFSFSTPPAPNRATRRWARGVAPAHAPSARRDARS
jgi:hypothetical protein